ncbi:hypothetical protein JTB14_005483 [Gonioctena quinquepunctata]|nr:hypothetical protein JTB14_005483 [Gonioctena quinquepunctata]
MHLPTQEGANQNTKCEPSISAPNLPNFQIGNLHVNILNKAYDSPKEDQERPGSPFTPFLDARTSTSENSPQNKEGNINLSNLKDNVETSRESKYMPKNKDIFRTPSDQEGSVHSYVGNLESEDVITFPHQLIDQNSSLLSPSEVQQTVDEGGSVIEFEIQKDGKLIVPEAVKEAILNISANLNETIRENRSIVGTRRSSRMCSVTISTPRGSGSEREIKLTQSEVEMYES